MRQRNIYQVKEQDKTPVKNEMATFKLPEAEFKTLVKGMLNELRERIDELIEKFRRESGNKNGDSTHKKGPVRNEEYITGNQHQISKSRGMNQTWKTATST